MREMNKSSERGQAIVLLAVGFVVLLGFTALAVDGGMMYSDRRYAQNAADAASLAGGGQAALSFENSGVTYSGWNCASSQNSSAASIARSAAISRAADNDFIIDADISDGHGVRVDCGVDTSGTHTDKYVDVTVDVTMDTRTSFVHFVYQGPTRNTVTAVTRVRPRTALAFGNAIVALNPNTCSGNSNGLQFRGNLNLDSIGGGVWSNGCMDVDGGNTPRLFNGGAAYFYGGNNLDNIEFYDLDGNPIAGSPIDLDEANDDRIPPESVDIPMPNCSGNTVTASWLTGQSGLSGLYCVTGDLRINNAGDSISGTDITLVFLGGTVTMNGGSNSLAAPPKDYTGDAIPGVLIYMPKQYYGPTCGEVNQELKINGNNFNEFVGTILAPCSDISLEGSTGTFAYQSQVIGWNVNSGGTADVKVVFDDEKQYSKPTSLDLYR
jgi:hypothetical protein